MSERSRRWAFQVLSIVIAGGLLYLALRGVDMNRVGQDLADGEYAWVVPLIIVTVLSHVIRAWRWTLLLNVLDGPERPTIGVFNAFKSLMIGYMANYAAPRLGEVVRTSHMAAKGRLPFGSVFGTVIAERALDVVSLGLALLTLPILLGPDLTRIADELLASVDASGWGTTVAAGTTLLIVLVAVGVWWIRRSGKQDRPESKIRCLLASFRSGITSIVQTGKPVQLIGSTLLMWVCYGLMGFWPFYIFQMTGDYGLTFADGWSLMLLGSIGVLIPSPGGIGSYHYIAITALTTLWGVAHSTASSYAIFTHGGQLILYVFIGFAALISDGSSWSELKSSGPDPAE